MPKNWKNCLGPHLYHTLSLLLLATITIFAIVMLREAHQSKQILQQSAVVNETRQR